jgi:hypothetical protein
MQPTYHQTKTCNNASIGAGVSLRAYVLLSSVFVTGCCNPMFERPCSPSPEFACSVPVELSCAETCANEPCTSETHTTDSCLNITGPQNDRPFNAPALPYLGSRIRAWGSQAGQHLHDNVFTRSIDAHKARRLAKIEAKNAPPWPTFHPIPTRPAFFPDDSQLMDNESHEHNSPGPTANYGQFAPANQ